jgi:hypothetical protein
MACGLSMFLGLAGCGGSGAAKSDHPPVVKASGLVTHNGKPLDGAIVVFQPAQQGGTAASATTDKEGRFSLNAFPPDEGAVPGSYKVGIMKVDTSGTPQNPEGSDGSVAVKQKSLIPTKYNNPVLSGLTAEIPPDGTDKLSFALKD